MELARKVLLHLVTNARQWNSASREVVMLTAVTDICLTSLANAPQLARSMAIAAQTNTLATNAKKSFTAAKIFHAARFVTKTKYVPALAAIFQLWPLHKLLQGPHVTFPQNNHFVEQSLANIFVMHLLVLAHAPPQNMLISEMIHTWNFLLAVMQKTWLNSAVLQWERKNH